MECWCWDNQSKVFWSSAQKTDWLPSRLGGFLYKLPVECTYCAKWCCAPTATLYTNVSKNVLSVNTREKWAGLSICFPLFYPANAVALSRSCCFRSWLRLSSMAAFHSWWLPLEFLTLDITTSRHSSSRVGSLESLATGAFKTLGTNAAIVRYLKVISFVVCA